MNPTVYPWQQNESAPACPECAPRGRLVGCVYSSRTDPGPAMQMWNADTVCRIAAARSDGGQTLNVTSKPQFGAQKDVVYRPETDVFAQIEAVVGREDLAAAAALRSEDWMAGGTQTRVIVLQFADPAEEITLDCLALEQHGRGDTVAALVDLLNDSVRQAAVVSETETPFLSPQAQVLRADRQAHGRLLSCVFRSSRFIDEGGRTVSVTNTYTAALQGGSETLTAEEKGDFRHTTTVVYRPAKSVLGAIETLADRENLWALSALRPQQGPGGLGFALPMGNGDAPANAIQLTTAADEPDAAPVITRLDVSLLCRHGLGYAVKALETILSDAAASADILSSIEEINERVRLTETLRQRREPLGALLSCRESCGDPQGDSFYVYTLARTEAGLTLTKEEKAQYRNRITTVFRPAQDLLTPLEAFAQRENLAAFAALKNGNPFETLTLTYAPAASGPVQTRTIGVRALREYGLDHLLTPIAKALREGSNGAALLRIQWDCRSCGNSGIEAAVCPVCGAQRDAVILPGQTNTAAQPPDEAAEGWRCARCGLLNTGRFCRDCGTPRA